MNQRIQELAWEAEDYAESIVDQGGGFHQAYTRKFAELIVQECIDCLKPLSRNHSMVGAAQDTIREHFGVENERTNSRTC